MRTATAHRADDDGFDNLRAWALTQIDRAGTARTTLDDADAWYGALAEVFRLTLEDVDRGERRGLSRRVRAQHQAWLSSEAA